MSQLAMQELDDGIGQALPVVHLEAGEKLRISQSTKDATTDGSSFVLLTVTSLSRFSRFIYIPENVTIRFFEL